MYSTHLKIKNKNDNDIDDLGIAYYPSFPSHLKRLKARPAPAWPDWLARHQTRTSPATSMARWHPSKKIIRLHLEPCHNQNRSWMISHDLGWSYSKCVSTAVCQKAPKSFLDLHQRRPELFSCAGNKRCSGHRPWSQCAEWGRLACAEWSSVIGFPTAPMGGPNGLVLDGVITDDGWLWLVHLSIESESSLFIWQTIKLSILKIYWLKGEGLDWQADRFLGSWVEDGSVHSGFRDSSL